MPFINNMDGLILCGDIIHVVTLLIYTLDIFVENHIVNQPNWLNP